MEIISRYLRYRASPFAKCPVFDDIYLKDNCIQSYLWCRLVINSNWQWASGLSWSSAKWGKASWLAQQSKGYKCSLAFPASQTCVMKYDMVQQGQGSIYSPNWMARLSSAVCVVCLSVVFDCFFVCCLLFIYFLAALAALYPPLWLIN